MAWARTHGIRRILIEPGRPMQNGFIGSFSGEFRDEDLNEQWLETLRQARAAAANLARLQQGQAAPLQTGSLRWPTE